MTEAEPSATQATPETGDRRLVVVIVSTGSDSAQDRARTDASVRTARQAGFRCLVVDLDGSYRATGDEQVHRLTDAARELDQLAVLNRTLATGEPEDLVLVAGAVGSELALRAGAERAVVVRAGVVVLPALERRLAEEPGPVLVPATDAIGALRRGRADEVLSRSLIVLTAADQARLLCGLAADWRVAGRALDLLAATCSVRVQRALVVSAWCAIGSSAVNPTGELVVDGALAGAVDLSGLDAERPWLLEGDAEVEPRLLLSEHPALTAVVALEAQRRRADTQDAATNAAAGWPGLDPVLRAEARRVVDAGGVLPDLLGAGGGVTLEEWATELVPAGHPRPVGRYLRALRASRGPLRRRFRAVPGPDSAALARFVLEEPDRSEEAAGADLIRRAAEVTLAAAPRTDVSSQPPGPLPPGVNVVGYLSGELGLGESARLVEAALREAGVPTSTFDVGYAIASRSSAAFRSTSATIYDTTLICVNAVETAALVPQLGPLTEGPRVIGMWYWELVDLPASHLVGFDHVDEVWAASDFMREAFAAVSGDVPVRTVTPPLPQATPPAGPLPDDFTVPEGREWFLFTFDFLSSAVRKNVLGLVEAFTLAFADRPEDARPVLVVKSINAAARASAAEQLRLLVAGRTDVLLLDGYLDHDQRHSLVARCTAYVSLHRAEGLGLTVAEAMAWGRPVVTTAYGGVMQFCDEHNAFLVDWQEARVEEPDGPYERGMRWAEPDLAEAAALMRAVVDDPARARVVADRGAADIRELHNPLEAGRRMRAALEEGRSAAGGRNDETGGSLTPADPASRLTRLRRPLRRPGR